MALISYSQTKEVFEDLRDKIKENFVEHWGSLKYTSGYKYENLLNYDSRVQGKYFPNQGTGDVQDSWHWSIFHCPVKPNEEYTVLRKFGDSGRFVFYDQQGTVVKVLELPYTNNINDWHRNFVKVPDNPNVAHMAFCFQTYDSGLNVKGRIMLLKESNIREKLEFIPYSNGTMVVVDGDKVSIQFNNSGTTLSENNLVGAIKELDVKIVNTGTVKRVNSQNPNSQGEVTVNAEHINYDDALTNLRANNVQDAIKKLKEDMALIDGAEIFIVPNKTELDNLLNQNVVRHGDLIYVINSTGVVDFDNQPANGGNPVAMIFDDSLNTGNELRVFSKFSSNVNVSANNVSYNDAQTQLNAQNVQDAVVKLNEKIANAGTVKSVNSQVPNQQNGSVTIDGTHINVDGTSTTTIKEELDKCVRTVNNQPPQLGGNVTVTANQIDAYVGNNVKKVQQHLEDINTKSNNNSNRISALESRPPSTTHIGEIITTFKDWGDTTFVINNVTYIYCGKEQRITNTQYPDLITALGLSNVASTNLPVIPDNVISYDYGTKQARRKHYICAKIR